jgi:hypothetical protein
VLCVSIVQSVVNKTKSSIALHDWILCKHSCIHDLIHALELEEILARGYSSSSEEAAAALPRACLDLMLSAEPPPTTGQVRRASAVEEELRGPVSGSATTHP